MMLLNGSLEHEALELVGTLVYHVTYECEIVTCEVTQVRKGHFGYTLMLKTQSDLPTYSYHVLYTTITEAREFAIKRLTFKATALNAKFAELAAEVSRVSELIQTYKVTE